MGYGQQSQSSDTFESNQGISGRSNYKKVFDSAMTFHVWAQQSQYEGRNAKGSVHFKGATIYSYGSHFPLATFLDSKASPRIVMLNRDRHSVTTSSHQSQVWRALKSDDTTISIYSTDLMIRASKAFSRFKESPEYLKEAIECARLIIAGIGPSSDEYKENAANALSRILGVKLNLKSILAAKLKADQKAEKDKKAKELKTAIALFKALPETMKRIESHKARNMIPRAYTRENDGLVTPTSYDVEKYVYNLLEAALRLNRSRRIVRQSGKHVALLQKASDAEKAFRAYANFWGFEQERLKTQEKTAQQRLDLANYARKARKQSGSPYDSNSDGWRIKSILANPSHSLYSEARRYPRILKLLSGVVAKDNYVMEMESTFETLNPRARDVVNTRLRTARNEKTVTPETWINGAKGYFVQTNPTLVRRVGEVLETSRQATAPFVHAVAIFCKAQDCLHKGTTWHRNGETMQAGHFQLEAINSNGDITIGCHVIKFEEMQRLALKETPQYVKPRYPLPAIIAA